MHAIKQGHKCMKLISYSLCHTQIGQLTFDNLLSDCIVELLLSGVGLEHAVKVIWFTLWQGKW